MPQQPFIAQGGYSPPYTPGLYFVRRAYGWNSTPAWTATNFRTDPGWVDTCPQLTTTALRTAAAARGIIRRMTLRLVTGSGIAVAEEAVPVTRWNSATEAAPILQTDWSPSLGQYQWWMRGFEALIEIEVELWFDIPFA